MVDAIIRGQGKRAAGMLGGYRGYLIMAPRDLFPSIALHRVQTAPPPPVAPPPGMPPQMISMPGWPPFMWAGMAPWMPPTQVAPGQAPPPGMLPPHYIHPVPPTPQPPVPVPVPLKVESAPIKAEGERDHGPSSEDAEKLFDSLITSSLMARRAPPPTKEVSPAPAPQAKAGGDAALETPKDARPERRDSPPLLPRRRGVPEGVTDRGPVPGRRPRWAAGGGGLARPRSPSRAPGPYRGGGRV
jgi:hypothetical protein